MMNYPYLLYSPRISHAPLFIDLTGDPFVLDLSRDNLLLSRIDVRDQKGFQRIIEEQMAPDHSWGVAGYLEPRDSLLRDCPQMVSESRFIHLGLDIIVPVGARLRAPLEAQVAESGYEAGEGNYGGYTLLRHELSGCEVFYSFYGHLCRERLPEPGVTLDAGEPFAAIGDFHENGNWFHHTHLQIITERGIARGYASKGYCSERDLAQMNLLCPSPVPLFRV